eukprot:g5171.t1
MDVFRQAGPDGVSNLSARDLVYHLQIVAKTGKYNTSDSPLLKAVFAALQWHLEQENGVWSRQLTQLWWTLATSSFTNLLSLDANFYEALIGATNAQLHGFQHDAMGVALVLWSVSKLVAEEKSSATGSGDFGLALDRERVWTVVRPMLDIVISSNAAAAGKEKGKGKKKKGNYKGGKAEDGGKMNFQDCANALSALGKLQDYLVVTNGDGFSKGDVKKIGVAAALYLEAVLRALEIQDPPTDAAESGSNGGGEAAPTKGDAVAGSTTSRKGKGKGSSAKGSADVSTIKAVEVASILLAVVTLGLSLQLPQKATLHRSLGRVLSLDSVELSQLAMIAQACERGRELLSVDATTVAALGKSFLKAVRKDGQKHKTCNKKPGWSMSVFTAAFVKMTVHFGYDSGLVGIWTEIVEALKSKRCPNSNSIQLEAPDDDDVADAQARTGKGSSAEGGDVSVDDKNNMIVAQTTIVARLLRTFATSTELRAELTTRKKGKHFLASASSLLYALAKLTKADARHAKCRAAFDPKLFGAIVRVLKLMDDELENETSTAQSAGALSSSDAATALWGLGTLSQYYPLEVCVAFPRGFRTLLGAVVDNTGR